MSLRAKFPYEEIDYTHLKNGLAEYACVRDKISRLLKAGTLVRVKKGLYVFGQEEARGPYSKEILANLIYGPSYISLAYALSYYGLIPEHTHELTSVTSKKNKAYDTPVGRFTYAYLNPKKFDIGVMQKTLPDGRPFLIASPEKAIADALILASSRLTLTEKQDIEAYLFEDMRYDESALEKLDLSLLSHIVDVYKKKPLHQLEAFLKGLIHV